MTDDSLLWTTNPPRGAAKTRGAALVVAEGDVNWSAELRYPGAYGVEAQILRNGELVIGRRFLLKERRRDRPILNSARTFGWHT